ncbi:hypothetical protein [Burkholderia cenocepacia]|uniref:hypothetical protein n=1 Tax=Burkholderia cenocepacia TaxID=95486 RepID=UPI002874C78B|nr:hypothetical protein [Burkholderia cenocepacia]MDS0850109.1 hypothetical protein [Burkholderia cenocepacia]
MTSFRHRGLFSVVPVIVVEPSCHDRRVLKRTNNCVRIKLRRFAEISEFVEQDQVHGHKVRGRNRKVLMSTFDVRSVGFDVNLKFCHACFVSSFDQLLASPLARSLAANQKVREGANRCAANRASRCRHSDEDRCFHSVDSFDETALRKRFPLEMAMALADVYFPPRLSAFERAQRFCRNVFRSWLGRFQQEAK